MAELLPRIISLGHALPDTYVVPMRQWAQDMGYKTDAAKRLADTTQIREKRLCMNPVGLSVQQLSEGYIKGALELSCRSLQECLPPGYLQRLGSLIYVTTTQQLQVCPSMSFRIARELGLPDDVRLVDLVGDGCEGALPGLETAYAHLKTFGQPVAIVACEVCSATFFPAPETDLANTISNFLFNDGAAAALVDWSDDGSFPAILSFHRRYMAEGLNLLGYTHQDGRLKVLLHKDVPKVVPPMVAQTVQELLARNHRLLAPRHLSVRDIDHWCIHNGGPAILDQVAGILELKSDQDFRYSWQVLRECGNLSSATVGVIAQQLHQDPANHHGYVVGCSMGAGAQVGAVLCRYG